MNANALETRRLNLHNAAGGLQRRSEGVARPPLMAKIAQIMDDNRARQVGGSK